MDIPIKYERRGQVGGWTALVYEKIMDAKEKGEVPTYKDIARHVFLSDDPKSVHKVRVIVRLLRKKPEGYVPPSYRRLVEKRKRESEQGLNKD